MELRGVELHETHGKLRAVDPVSRWLVSKVRVHTRAEMAKPGERETDEQ